jgi:shikimate kinase
MNIILIGMPASGKSCMGRALSRAMRIKNIDTDRIIEKKIGRKLQSIINEDGLSEFKRIEEDILCSINGEDTIISTGGSAVYYESAMEHFRDIGVVVYLYTSLATITKRLGDFSKRGVALRDGQTLEDLYNERCVLYEKYAHIICDMDGKTIEDNLKTVLDAIEKSEA